MRILLIFLMVLVSLVIGFVVGVAAHAYSQVKVESGVLWVNDEDLYCDLNEPLSTIKERKHILLEVRKLNVSSQK